MDITSESKQLAIQLKAKEECYVTGQLDLNTTLDETERLYREVKKSDEERITANEILPDSHLMRLQAGLAKRSAKFYKPDSLVFNATDFAIKLRLFYDQSSVQQNGDEDDEISEGGGELLWLQLGEEAKKLLHTVPSFSFMQGVFDPDAVQTVKKKRRIKEKDKVGDLTKPQSMKLKDSTDSKDPTVVKAERMLGILQRLLKTKKVQSVCFYEFITDPASFGRTIENIFILSLLVNQNCVQIVRDGNGLPCLSVIDEKAKAERNHTNTKQCILSITKDEWKDIVNTFKFKTAVIPPQRF